MSKLLGLGLFGVALAGCLYIASPTRPQKPVDPQSKHLAVKAVRALVNEGFFEKVHVSANPVAIPSKAFMQMKFDDKAFWAAALWLHVRTASGSERLILRDLYSGKDIGDVSAYGLRLY